LIIDNIIILIIRHHVRGLELAKSKEQECCADYVRKQTEITDGHCDKLEVLCLLKVKKGEWNDDCCKKREVDVEGVATGEKP